MTEMTKPTEPTDVRKKVRAGNRGGRPSKPLAERRTERISFGVTKRQKAAFLVSASGSGMTSNDYARKVLCDDTKCDGQTDGRANTFELIDSLSRIGVDL